MAISRSAVWLWRSKVDCQSGADNNEWRRFSDTEILIIEDAYQQKRDRVELDQGDVDFKHQVQISKDDPSEQVSVKRTTDMSPSYVRRERFRVDPSEVGVESFTRNFTTFDQAAQMEKIPKGDLIEKAARGIEEEGDKIGKTKEAQAIGNLLRQLQGKNNRQVGQCCIRLFTMESFLYHHLNKVMRERSNLRHHLGTLLSTTIHLSL
jgi:hypothetical protein